MFSALLLWECSQVNRHPPAIHDLEEQVTELPESVREAAEVLVNTPALWPRRLLRAQQRGTEPPDGHLR